MGPATVQPAAASEAAATASGTPSSLTWCRLRASTGVGTGEQPNSLSASGRPSWPSLLRPHDHSWPCGRLDLTAWVSLASAKQRLRATWELRKQLQLNSTNPHHFAPRSCTQSCCSGLHPAPQCCRAGRESPPARAGRGWTECQARPARVRVCSFGKQAAAAAAARQRR